MDIFVNNKLVVLQTGFNITDALVSLGIDTRNNIAIAVNNNVISKTNWTDYVLAEGDKITIIKATQGG